MPSTVKTNCENRYKNINKKYTLIIYNKCIFTKTKVKRKIMIGDSLSMENLLAIFQAMQKIEPIDQSEHFRQYYAEVVRRLSEQERAKKFIEQQLGKIK